MRPILFLVSLIAGIVAVYLGINGLLAAISTPKHQSPEHMAAMTKKAQEARAKAKKESENTSQDETEQGAES